MNFYKSILKEVYSFVRHKLIAGKGLSRYRLLREINFRIEKYLRGPRQEIFTYDGFKFHSDPRGALVVSEKERPHPIRRFMAQNLREGGVFVDVGACIGFFTLPASRIVGRNGRVYAFEPHPVSFEILRKNITENDCGNIVAENLLVDNKNGEKILYTVGNLLYGSSVIDPRTDPDLYITPHLAKGEDSSVREVKVHAVSLDSYFKDKKIDFVKIDVEGNEEKVIRGMTGLITANPDIVIVAEFLPTILKKNGTDPAGYLDYIKSLGLSIFVLSDKGISSLEGVPKKGVDLVFRRTKHLNYRK